MIQSLLNSKFAHFKSDSKLQKWRNFKRLKSDLDFKLQKSLQLQKWLRLSLQKSLQLEASKVIITLRQKGYFVSCWIRGHETIEGGLSILMPFDGIHLHTQCMPINLNKLLLCIDRKMSSEPKLTLLGWSANIQKSNASRKFKGNAILDFNDDTH